MTNDSDMAKVTANITFPDELLRELHAAAALAGILARDRGPGDLDALTRLAYLHADAMLAARSTPPPPPIR